jgi:hypothetical protein
MGNTTTAVRGRAIITMPKRQLDNLLPDWHTFTAAAEVKFAAIDEQDPKTFFVFPPQPATNNQKVELLLSEMPNDISEVTDSFPLDDSFISPVVDGTISRMLLEETSIPHAQEKGQTYQQRFMQSLGLKSNVEKQVSQRAIQSRAAQQQPQQRQ